jgi:hypothetical protein
VRDDDVGSTQQPARDAERSLRGGPCCVAGRPPFWFTKGEDRIDLSIIDADTTLAGNQTFIFDTGATAPSVGVVTYDPDGYVFAANDTVAGWDLVIQTAPNLTLGSGDFIL